MAESIKGSSSSLYIKEEVPSVTNSADTMNHLSVQNLWGARGAADTLVHGVHRHTALPVLIEAGSVKRKIKITGHGAIAGDFLKMNNGLADGEEVSIIKVIDADYFVISKEINASVGDEAFVLKPVTQRLAKDGGIAVTQGPIEIVKDSVTRQVNKDTATDANTVAIPVEVVFEDGTPIQKHVDGLNIYIKVHDTLINDSITDGTSQFTKVTDGTTTMLITGSGEAKVSDASSLAKLTTIDLSLDDIVTHAIDIRDNTADTVTQLTTLNGKDFATQTTLAALLAELQAKADLTETQPVNIQNTNLDIRDLVFANDKVDVSGSSVTVSSTDLDVRNLVFASDKVDVSGSSVSISGTTSVSQVSEDAKYAESTSINTTATAVLSATQIKRLYIQALDTNTVNLRVKITTTGAAATTTSGWQFQPGRSDSFEMGGTTCTVSVCSESGTNQGVVIQYA